MSSDALLSHLPILPILWPLAAGILLLAFTPRATDLPTGSDHLSPLLWRPLRCSSLLFAAGTLILSGTLFYFTGAEPIRTYALGNWPPPFGIVLVADPLAALFVFLTAIIAFTALLFAIGGWDARGRAFHPLWHLQWAGLNGAFLTGDIFNLFVFFEVLLIASYALLTHGLGAERLRAGFGYVVVNLTASALFLIALALIYGAFGTLNLAHLADLSPQLDADRRFLAQTAVVLLFTVFAVKAALAPLYLWLPSAYTSASPPVAALFALMTKVGVYALIRVHWATFPLLADPLFPPLLFLSLATTLAGAIGALAVRSLTRIVAFLAISSIGTILTGVSLLTPKALAAALFYLIHSTLTLALLFLTVALVAAERGSIGDKLRPAPAVKDPVVLGLLTLFAAASVVGLPPLPGFLGKSFLLTASIDHPTATFIWGILLTAGAITLLALTRAGITIFWHTKPAAPTILPSGRSRSLLLPVAFLVGILIALVFFAEPIYRQTLAAAEQARHPHPLPDTTKPVLRPYDGRLPSFEEP